MAAHHLVLLLHLRHLLGVLVVHLLQLSHHALAALAQSLLVVDELQGEEEGRGIRVLEARPGPEAGPEAAWVPPGR